MNSINLSFLCTCIVFFLFSIGLIWKISCDLVWKNSAAYQECIMKGENPHLSQLFLSQREVEFMEGFEWGASGGRSGQEVAG